MGGAHNIEIGHSQQLNRVIVVGHDDGDGILISGSDTREVRVVNTVIGSNIPGDAGLGNLNGIRIADGAHSNLIGYRGEVVESEFFQDFPERIPYNVIQGNTNGIVLASGGTIDGSITPGEPVETPRNSNVVQNNWIGQPPRITGDTRAVPNEVGILILPGATSNRIGGVNESSMNRINRNARAGIEIAGVVSTVPALANRIIGNEFQFNGLAEDPQGDPLTTAPRGVGILISGGSKGQTIGGFGAASNNFFWRNHVGVMIDGTGADDDTDHRIVGNTFSTNRTAGVMVRHAYGVLIGPNNEFFANGRAILGVSAPTPAGGIALAGGGRHEVYANRIGSNLSNANSDGNQNIPYGVAIHDSAGNQIGGLGLGKRNVIVRNVGGGVLLDGADATGNRIQNNLIGLMPGPRQVAAPNVGGGVLIRGGAAGNLIGGRAPIQIGGSQIDVVAGNFIHTNQGPGVSVEGTGTNGNTITYNSITGHGGSKGIELTNAGNREIFPPTIDVVNGTEVFGFTSGAPDGSLVQIFTDPGGEGEVFVADAIVTAGDFDATPVLALPSANVTATVTHPNGDTSEFSPIFLFTEDISALGFDVRRDIPAPLTRSAPLNQLGLLGAIRLTALENDEKIVVLDSITLTAEGTADESTAITGLRLFEDANGDGELDASDPVVGTLQPPPSTDNGPTTIKINYPVRPEQVKQLLLAAELSGQGTAGETIVFRVSGVNEVRARVLLPPTEIQETGSFPLVSDTLTLTLPIADAGEIVSYLLTGSGDTTGMDRNDDGVINIADVVTAIQPGDQ